MSNSGNNTVAILGIPVDNVSMGEAIDIIQDHITEGGFHQVATVNVDFLTRSIHDDEVKEILCRCDLVLADGMPLVWASRWMGVALKERVPGVDLVPELVALSAQRGYRLFLLGAEEESCARAAAWMEWRYPGVCIAGRYSPEVSSLDEMDHEEILRRIEAASPDILLVAFGHPKQEKWLAMHRQRLNVPICIGIGGTLDLLGGTLRRAPEWMQTNGLEWAYRCLQEPTRLAKRYFDDAVCMLRYLTLQLAASASQRRNTAKGTLTTDSRRNATVIRIGGSLSGDLELLLQNKIRNAIFSGKHVILDANDITYIGPDALGSLLRLVTLARRWKRDIWLTGLQPLVARLINAALLRSQFRIAPKATDALRRIEPDPASENLSPTPEWAYCHIGNELVPIHASEIQGLYYQIRVLMESRNMGKDVRSVPVRIGRAVKSVDGRLQDKVSSLDALAASDR